MVLATLKWEKRDKMWLITRLIKNKCRFCIRKGTFSVYSLFGDYKVCFKHIDSMGDC